MTAADARGDIILARDTLLGLIALRRKAPRGDPLPTRERGADAGLLRARSQADE